MKKTGFIFLILLFLSVGTTEIFAQCSCTKYTSEIKATEELDNSDVVFTGKIIKVEKTEPDKRNYYFVTATFEVDEIWKGEVKQTFIIKNLAAGCINGFKKDQEWLIYGYKKEDGTFATGCCCSKTNLLSKAKKDLEEFKKNGMKAKKFKKVQNKEQTQ